MTENIRRQLGEKARELRKAAKLTQQDVADKLGVRQADVSSFESKGDVIGSVERINALFNLFDCELTVSEKKNSIEYSIERRTVNEIEHLIADLDAPTPALDALRRIYLLSAENLPKEYLDDSYIYNDVG